MRFTPLSSRFLSLSLFVVAMACSAAEPPKTEREAVEIEIQRMLETLHWRNMIAISLARGDIQRAAKRDATSEQQQTCIDAEYTEEAILNIIAAAYARIYTSSQVLAEINDFFQRSGGQKILSNIAAQSKLVGARVAAEQLVPELVLTPVEQKEFELFAASTAGRQYLEARRRLPTIQRELLAEFAVAVQGKCGVLPR